jgi:hypothetical protein
VSELIAHLDPALRGEYVFARVETPPPGINVFATIVEDEGTTIVLERAIADELGLPYAFVATMITLQVYSDLSAVGLTASFATELAGAGISCNVIAGIHHDHLFVPAQRGVDAMRLLQQMALTAQRQAR